MNGKDRQKAALEAALRRLEEEMRTERRRASTAVERIAEGVVKILGGNIPPTYQKPEAP